MAEKNKVAPPVAASREAASGGGATSLEAHGGEPLSNGKCAVSDTVRRLQTDSICESPTWESSASDSSSKTIPRRSSLIKVGPRHRGDVRGECTQTVAEDSIEGSWRCH